MILTDEIIRTAGTSKIGFNWHQLRLLGVAWPPKHGWIQKLIGQEVNDQTWLLVLSMKDKPKKVRNQILRARGIDPGRLASSKLKPLPVQDYFHWNK